MYERKETSAGLIKLLDNSSKLRLKQDNGLIKLQKDIERFEKIRSRKSVSLNEKQRLKEYYDEKAAADKVEALMHESEKSSDKKKAPKDLLLQETLRIAAEYCSLLNSGKTKP